MTRLRILRLPAAIALMAAILLSGGCDISPRPAREATLALDLPEPGAGARTLWPEGNNNFYLAHHYDLNASGPDGMVVSRVGIDPAGIELVQGGFIEGTWSVTVTAYNIDNDPIGLGTATADLLALPATNLVPVTVEPFAVGGDGTLSISLSWDFARFAATELQITVTPITASGTTQTVSAMATELADGNYDTSIALAPGLHRLNVTLYKAGPTVGWGVVESVYIAGSLVTAFSRENIAIESSPVLPAVTGPYLDGALDSGGVIVDANADGSQNAPLVGTPISFQTPDAGAVIVYTLDEDLLPTYDYQTSTPGTGSRVYTGPLVLSRAFENEAVAEALDPLSDGVLHFRVRAFNFWGGSAASTDVAYYVSDAVYAIATASAGGNRGTMTDPIGADLQATLDRAARLARARATHAWVRAATGVYDSAAEGFLLADGACLSGGWSADFTARPIMLAESLTSANATALRNPSTTAAANPVPTLRNDAAAPTVMGNAVDLVFIESASSRSGAGGVCAAALSGYGARPIRFARVAFRGMGDVWTASYGAYAANGGTGLVFADCYFLGRTGPSGSMSVESVGLRIEAASPEVRGGAAIAGAGMTGGGSAGVMASAPAAAPCAPSFGAGVTGRFQARGATSGTAGSTIGMWLTYADAVIISSDIDATASDAVTTPKAMGICAIQSYPRIQGCAINAAFTVNFFPGAGSGYGIYYEGPAAYAAGGPALELSGSTVYSAGGGTQLPQGAYAIACLRGEANVHDNPVIEARGAAAESAGIYLGGPGTIAGAWVRAVVTSNGSVLSSNGSSGAVNAGVRIGNGMDLPVSARIEGNRLEANGIYGTSVAGLDVRYPLNLAPGLADIEVRGNNISGGDGYRLSGSAAGLSVLARGNGATFLIERNRVWGGCGFGDFNSDLIPEGNAVHGIYFRAEGAQSGAVVIRNNIVMTGANPDPVKDFAAIRVQTDVMCSGSIRVYNNTVFANGNLSNIRQCGLYLGGMQRSIIANNIIYAGSQATRGVYQESIVDYPMFFRNNAIYADGTIPPGFYFSNSALTQDPNGVIVGGTANYLGAWNHADAIAYGAFAASVAFFSGATPMPTDLAIRFAGLSDPSSLGGDPWLPANDIDGLPRTIGWTVGAREWD